MWSKIAVDPKRGIPIPSPRYIQQERDRLWQHPESPPGQGAQLFQYKYISYISGVSYQSGSIFYGGYKA